MTRLTFLFIVFATLLSSCKTKQYIMQSTNQDLSQLREILVVKNKYSYIIPVGVYPQYNSVDGFVIKKDSAIVDIANLVCEELLKRQINCEILNKRPEIGNGLYYVEYQDYWAWDFKKYMHVLKIRIYKEGKEIESVASQGNAIGMHDYPNPKKQIPLLIDLLLKN